MQQVINILFAVPDFGGDLIVRIQLLPPGTIFIVHQVLNAVLPPCLIPGFILAIAMGDSPSICLYFAWFYAKFDLFLLSRILPDFATVFAHKKKVLPPVDLHRTDKTRQTPRRGRTRRGVGHYFPSSLSAAVLSYCKHEVLRQISQIKSSYNDRKSHLITCMS